MNSDTEHFLSADKADIYLWNFNYDCPRDLVSIRAKINDEYLTHAEFHPRRSDVFLYTSSKGNIDLCDLRVYSSFRQGIRFQKNRKEHKKVCSATFAA